MLFASASPFVYINTNLSKREKMIHSHFPRIPENAPTNEQRQRIDWAPRPVVVVVVLVVVARLMRSVL
jgi:hypothetical protein